MAYNFYRSITGFIIVAGLMTLGITAQGQIITTIAGNGVGAGSPNSSTSTGDGGQATAAGFDGPWGVVVDDSGNVYVCDSWSSLIRKISASTGVINTIAGGGTSGLGDGGPATAAQLDLPQDMALDDSGNVYFTDLLNYRIRKITKATGIISTVAGNGTDGYNNTDGIAATNANLSLAYTVAVDDSGNIYIADTYNNRIRKVTKATGIINTIAGNGTNGYSGDNGPATDAEFNLPFGMALDDSDNIYIADSKNNVVRKVTKATGIITPIAGNFIAGGGYSGDNGPATSAQVNSPDDIAVDSSGNVYISNQYNNRIRMVSEGVITTFAGDGFGAPNSGGYSGDNGPATAAEIYYTEGIALDKCGNVYIADYYNQRIRKVTLSDTISAAAKISSICSGRIDTLTASGATTYKWSPSATLSDTTGSIVIANPSVTTTYTVIGTTPCFGATAPKTIVVTIIPAPPLTIQPMSPSTCAGQPLTLSVDTTGSDYTWSPATGLNVTTGDSVIASPYQQATYTVTGIDSLGCMVTASDTITIKRGINKPIITDTNNVLTTTATQGNQWYGSGIEINGATNEKYTATDTGCYWEIATNIANGCSSVSDTICITSLAGIKQLAVNSDQLSIYPNPTGGAIFVNISSSVGELKDWYLQITDVLGL